MVSFMTVSDTRVSAPNPHANADSHMLPVMRITAQLFT